MLLFVWSTDNNFVYTNYCRCFFLFSSQIPHIYTHIPYIYRKIKKEQCVHNVILKSISGYSITEFTWVFVFLLFIFRYICMKHKIEDIATKHMNFCKRLKCSWNQVLHQNPKRNFFLIVKTFTNTPKKNNTTVTEK